MGSAPPRSRARPAVRYVASGERCAAKQTLRANPAQTTSSNGTAGGRAGRTCQEPVAEQPWRGRAICADSRAARRWRARLGPRPRQKSAAQAMHVDMRGESAASRVGWLAAEAGRVMSAISRRARSSCVAQHVATQPNVLQHVTTRCHAARRAALKKPDLAFKGVCPTCASCGASCGAAASGARASQQEMHDSVDACDGLSTAAAAGLSAQAWCAS